MSKQTFKGRIIRAGGWTTGAHIVAQALRLMASVILTRIFSPDVYGTLGIITALIVTMSLLTDFGIRQAVVQSKSGGSINFIQTAWTIQVLRGFFIWMFVCTLAALLCAANNRDLLPRNSVYNNELLPALIVASSFSAVILGFQSMKAITAERNLELPRVVVVELISQFVGMVVAILLGWLTRSIWSYIVAQNLTAILSVWLSHVYLQGSADRFAWDKSSVEELSRFGRWVLASSSINAAASNGDKLLLASWVSSASFGYYSLASNLTTVVENLCYRVFGTVALPALSEIQRGDPRRFTRFYFRMRWVSDLAIISFAGFLYCTGPFIVSILYDERYADAGWMLQWLSFGLIFVRHSLTSNAYLALGRPHYVTFTSLAKLVSLFLVVPSLYLGFGVEGAILGVAFHMLPVVCCYYAFDRKLGINNTFLEFAALVAWPVGWLLGNVLLVLARGALSLLD